MTDRDRKVALPTKQVLPSNGIPLNRWPPTPPVIRDKRDVFTFAGGTKERLHEETDAFGRDRKR